MKVNYFSFFMQFVIGVTLYYVFDYLGLTRLFTVALVIVIIIIAVINIIKTKNKEMYLEVACDPNRYLEKLEPMQYREPFLNEYQLSLAYAYIYKGEYGVAQTHFEQVSFENIKNKEKYYPIYIKVNAKIAYEQQNMIIIQQLLSELEQEEKYKPLLDYCKILISLLQEKYEEATQLLIEYIPTQMKRVFVIELEYYLGYAYYKIDKLEDARAVFEFIVKKGFSIVYTDLAYDLYMEIKE